METGKVKKVRCTEGRKGRHIHHKNPLAKGSACEPCRQRKVRCDGQLPACKACIRTAKFKRQDVQCCYLDASDEQRGEQGPPAERIDDEVSDTSSWSQDIIAAFPQLGSTSTSPSAASPSSPSADSSASSPSDLPLALPLPLVAPQNIPMFPFANLPWTSSAAPPTIIYAIPPGFSPAMLPMTNSPWTFVVAPAAQALPFLPTPVLNTPDTLFSAPLPPLPEVDANTTDADILSRFLDTNADVVDSESSATSLPDLIGGARGREDSLSSCSSSVYTAPSGPNTPASVAPHTTTAFEDYFAFDSQLSLEAHTDIDVSSLGVDVAPLVSDLTKGSNANTITDGDLMFSGFF